MAKPLVAFVDSDMEKVVSVKYNLPDLLAPSALSKLLVVPVEPALRSLIVLPLKSALTELVVVPGMSDSPKLVVVVGKSAATMLVVHHVNSDLSEVAFEERKAEEVVVTASLVLVVCLQLH